MKKLIVLNKYGEKMDWKWIEDRPNTIKFHDRHHEPRIAKKSDGYRVVSVEVA